jgi:hypothetical protein
VTTRVGSGRLRQEERSEWNREATPHGDLLEAKAAYVRLRRVEGSVAERLAKLER